MNRKIPYSILLSLILVVPTTLAQGQGEFKVFVASDTIHELGLKAIQMENSQIIPTSNFAISPDSVVQIKQNANLTVFTSTNEPGRIQTVKVINSNGLTTELVPPQYSLRNLPIGVYTLNVIVNDPTTSSLNAYETLLIILAPDQPPIQKTEINNIIQKQTQKVIVEVDFNKGKGKGCSNKPGSARLPFPYQNKSECDHNEYQKCIRDGKIISQECIKWVDEFTHKCDEFKTQKECDKFYEDNRRRLYCIEHYGIPCCDDVNTPSGDGKPCYDEGDTTDCEPGFIDSGNGCELVEEEEEGTVPLPVFPIEDNDDSNDGSGDNGNNDNDSSGGSDNDEGESDSGGNGDSDSEDSGGDSSEESEEG